jgi:hypothetical protein
MNNNPLEHSVILKYEKKENGNDEETAETRTDLREPASSFQDSFEMPLSATALNSSSAGNDQTVN